MQRALRPIADLLSTTLLYLHWLPCKSASSLVLQHSSLFFSWKLRALLLMLFSSCSRLFSTRRLRVLASARSCLSYMFSWWTYAMQCMFLLFYQKLCGIMYIQPLFCVYRCSPPNNFSLVYILLSVVSFVSSYFS